MKDFDSVVKTIGEFGTFQKKVFYGVQLTSFSLNLQMLVLVFVAAQPNWSCLSEFSGAPRCTRAGTICPKARFSPDFTSIATEWNLVCGQAYKNELVQSIFMAGTMFGALLIGRMTDKHGRKNMWIVSVTGGLFVSFLSAFATSYNMFLALRFVAGLFVGGERLVMYVLATESVGPSYRGTTGMLSQGFFAISIAVLGVLAYYIRHWRTLIIATCIPSIPCLLMFKYIPESPRWLVAKGRLKEAEKILQQAAVENKKDSVDVTLDSVTPKAESAQTTTVQYGFIDLFIIPSLRIITLITMAAWFVNGLVYYGLSLNVKNLGGNFYLTFIFAALVEIPSYTVTGVLMEWLGRRRAFFGFMMAAAVACYTCMKLQLSPDSNSLITVAAMLGKFCISASYAVVYVYAAELFPTVVRSIGLGMTSVSSRLGGILSPLVVLLAEYDKTLPMMVFTVVALVAGMLGLTLPETKGKSLPDTLEENRSQKIQKAANGEKLD